MRTKTRPHGVSRGRPPSRSERRRAARVRRNRVMVVAAAAVSVIVLVSWFPASELEHQHQQVAAAVTQLDRLHRQNEALSDETKRLQTPSQIASIAEQQYGLEKPGQQDYQVLPPSGSSNGRLATSGRSGTSPASGGGSNGAPGATSSGVSGQGFFERVTQTLEFWR